MKLSRGSLALSSLLLVSASLSQAAVTVTWTQVGDKFHGTVSGSFSDSELSAHYSSYTQTDPVGGYFDTSPGFLVVVNGQTDLTYRHYWNTVLTRGPGNANLNIYSGATVSGTSSIGFYDTFNGPYALALSTSYVAGSEISATIISNRDGMTLAQAFFYGDVFQLYGQSFITYVNGGVVGGAIPEPSTYGLALGGFALAGVLLRRRSKRA